MNVAFRAGTPPPPSRLSSTKPTTSEIEFRSTVENYRALAYGIARRVTGETFLAENVVQQVFLELWQFPHRFVGQPIRVSVATLAHSRAVDLVRHEQRHQNRHERWRMHAVPEHQPDHAETKELGDDLLRRRDAARTAVGMLAPSHRRAIELAYFEGHTYREVAQLLDIPEGTAKTRIRSALRQLAEILAP